MAELNITYEDGAEFFTTTYRGTTVSATLAFLTCGKNIVELINKKPCASDPSSCGINPQWKITSLTPMPEAAEATAATVKENLKAVELGKTGLDMGTPAPKPSVVSIKPEFDWSDKYDSKEVARLFGVSMPHISTMKKEGTCPQPDGKTGLACWWHKSTIDEFFKANDTLKEDIAPEAEQVDIEDAIAETEAVETIEEEESEAEAKAEVFDNFQDIRARLKQGLGRGDE